MSTSALAHESSPARSLVIAALLVLYVVWGSTYFALHLALSGFSPFLLGGIRFTTAGALLFTVLYARGERAPRPREWLSALLVGALLFGGANGCLAFAQQWVSSSVASLVSATMPLWMALFGWGFGEAPTRREWMGLVLGFFGVALIHAGGGLEVRGLTALVLIASPASWALGSLVSKRVPAARGPMANAAQMLGGGLTLSLLAMAHGERYQPPGLVAFCAFAYLVLVGSLVGFVAYGFLLRHTRPALATSYAYVNPVVAVMLGVGFGGEALSAGTLLGALVILAAVALITSPHMTHPNDCASP